MNKMFLPVMLLLSGLVSAYGEAPELRYVMPNSWRKVTRLSGEEEASFLERNQTLLDNVAKESREPFESSHGERFSIRNSIRRQTRVYREEAGENIFYRLVTVNSDTPDFTNQWEIRFLQTLVYDHQGTLTILVLGTYNHGAYAREFAFTSVSSIDIIMSGNKAKGILVNRMGYSVNETTRSYPHLMKGQISGDGYAYYVLMDDIIDSLSKSPGIVLKWEETGTILPTNVFVIKIAYSSCLVDKSIPLRYGIQSAFDGDPATSYVENTGDDLMQIWIYIKIDDFIRCAIINGYAQNMSLYNENNRIKSLWVDKHKTELRDNILSYQFVNNANQCLYISDVYKGTKYNDTCLAEYNVYIVEKGWLFGHMENE
jgi:hypothetical protein